MVRAETVLQYIALEAAQHRQRGPAAHRWGPVQKRLELGAARGFARGPAPESFQVADHHVDAAGSEAPHGSGWQVE